MLGVRRDEIDRHGAVSEAVAKAMVRGALEYSGADIALAITGYAGAAPRGEEDGLVHFACMRRGGTPRHRAEHFGPVGRGPVRIGSLRIALKMMRDAVDEH